MTKKRSLVHSPCVRNCCLDDNDVCLGCYRTMQEVMDWHHADDVQKKHILARAQQRRDHQKMK